MLVGKLILPIAAMGFDQNDIMTSISEKVLKLLNLDLIRDLERAQSRTEKQWPPKEVSVFCVEQSILGRYLHTARLLSTTQNSDDRPIVARLDDKKICKHWSSLANILSFVKARVTSAKCTPLRLPMLERCSSLGVTIRSRFTARAEGQEERAYRWE